MAQKPPVAADPRAGNDPRAGVDQALITDPSPDTGLGPEDFCLPGPADACSAKGMNSEGMTAAHRPHGSLRLVGVNGAGGIEVTGRFSQSIFQQKGTKIGHRTSFILRAREKRFMHVITEGDGDSSGLALHDAKAFIHRMTPEKEWGSVLCCSSTRLGSQNHPDGFTVQQIPFRFQATIC